MYKMSKFWSLIYSNVTTVNTVIIYLKFAKRVNLKYCKHTKKQ